MKSPLIASASLLAAMAWVVALIVDPGPLPPTSTLLVGIGLVTMSTVATVGIVLSGGRWALRYGFVSLGASLAVAAIRPIDVWWVVALLATAVGFGSLFMPGVVERVRKLPSATGPPPRAVVLALVLVSVPYLVGLTSVEGTPWAMLLVSFSALVTVFLYIRAITGSVVAVRVLWPVLAIVVAPFVGVPGSIVTAVIGLTVAVLAWHPSVKLAVYPPVEKGSGYAIPPELTPSEILDAAQIDDKGRPK